VLLKGVGLELPHRHIRVVGPPPNELVLAIFNKNTAGCDSSGNIIESKQQWKNFFENHIPNEFVMKPTLYITGDKVMYVQRYSSRRCSGW